MKDLVGRNAKWKYLINLASQAFPMKTNEELVQILKVFNGSNDIAGRTGKAVSQKRYFRHCNVLGNLCIFDHLSIECSNNFKDFRPNLRRSHQRMSWKSHC